MSHGLSVAYLAGFVDADGCVTKSGKYWEVVVAQSEVHDLAPLYALQQRWGGSVYKTTKPKEHYTQPWRWKVRGIEAAIALHDMYWYLVTKKVRATQALEELGSIPKIGRILLRLNEPL